MIKNEVSDIHTMYDLTLPNDNKKVLEQKCIIQPTRYIYKVYEG